MIKTGNQIFNSERKKTTGLILDPLLGQNRSISSGGDAGKMGLTESAIESMQLTNPVFSAKITHQRSKEQTSRSLALEKNIFASSINPSETAKKPNEGFKPALNLRKAYGDGPPQFSAKMNDSGLFKPNTMSLLNSANSFNPKVLLEKKEKLYLLDKMSNQVLLEEGADDGRILTVEQVLERELFPKINDSVSNSRNPQVFKKLFLQKIAKSMKL